MRWMRQLFGGGALACVLGAAAPAWAAECVSSNIPITTNGTCTIPSDATNISVTLWGGGGGGARYTSGHKNGGGGGGGASCQFSPAAGIGLTYNIGAGGTAGAGGSNNGGTGGDTNVNGRIAKGGTGAAGGTSGAGGNTGNAWDCSGGTPVAGSSGSATVNNNFAGAGGNAASGAGAGAGGAAGTSSSKTGKPGSVPGGGGGGGFDSAPGGAGGSGGVVITFVVPAAPTAQTITWTQTLNNLAVTAAGPTLTATASSGLAVTYSGTTNVCTVAGSQVSLVGIGTCTITAQQAGNASYAAATDVTKSFAVYALPGSATVTVVPGLDSATVSWTAPAANNSPISGYAVMATPAGGGAIACPVNGMAATCSITGGKDYTFDVYAANEAGTAAIGSQTVPVQTTGTLSITGASSVNWSSGGTTPVIVSTNTGQTPALTASGTCTMVSGSAAVNLVSAGICTVSGSTNATPYYTAASTSATITINAIAPATPGTPTASVAGTAMTVNWTAPAHFGGSSLQQYEVTATAPGGVNLTCSSTSATSCVIPGITLGKTYSIVVKATSQANQFSSSAPGTYDAVGTPTVTVGSLTTPVNWASAGSTQALTATAMPADAQAANLAITYNAVGTPANACSASGTTLTLSNVGTCAVTATTTATTLWASATSQPVTITVKAVAPNAPTSLVLAGNTLSWTAPTITGGEAITGYTATATPTAGGAPVSCTPSPSTATSCAFSNLTGGQNYDFAVTVTNAANLTATATLTAQPIVGTPTVTLGSLTTPVNWASAGSTQNLTATAKAPDSSVLNLAITYNAVGTPANACSASGTMLTLSNVGTCAVTATTTATTLWASATSQPVTITVKAVAPNAPTSLVLAGNTLSWTAPTITGGEAITGYTVTATPTTGSPPASLLSCSPGTATSCTFASLPAGTTYTFSVTANNSAGPSQPSTMSQTVIGTPTLALSLPASVVWSSTPVTQALSATITPADAASANLVVTYTASPANVCEVTGSAAPYSLSLKAVGTCTVTASSAATTLWAAATTATPATVQVTAGGPGAPGMGAVLAGDTKAKLSWTAPTNTGGQAITHYRVKADNGAGSSLSATLAATVTSHLFTGLTNGTTYTITLEASNDGGTTWGTGATGTVKPDLLSGQLTGAKISIAGNEPGCTLASATNAAPAAGETPANVDAGASFPAGLLKFKVAGCDTSAPATLKVTVTYDTAQPEGAAVWKYGPAAAGAPATWQELPGALDASRKVVSYTVVDNGVGDSNPAVGEVDDPMLVVAAAATTPTTPTTPHHARRDRLGHPRAHAGHLGPGTAGLADRRLGRCGPAPQHAEGLSTALPGNKPPAGGLFFGCAAGGKAGAEANA